MLKLECPACKEWIHSPFLMDLDEMQCPGCGTTVMSKDVYISAGPFSIYREALQKNLPKYTRLLLEAEKELSDMEKAGDLRPYNISAESIRLFVTNIKEMLDGCRNGFRVNVKDSQIGYTHLGSEYNGRIINLSSTGICVETTGAVPGMRKGDAVEMRIGLAGGLVLTGQVMWVKGAQAGLRFTGMDKEKKIRLVDFVQGKTE